MYHQFHELAGVDITQEPMEVGPTTHYIMGGIRVDGDTQMSTMPGLFAAGECAAGLHGANRLGGNSLSDLLVFGKRAGAAAAAYASNLSNEPNSSNLDDQINAASQWSLAPFDKADGENPYLIQKDLQTMMQDLVGIVRTESEMEQALEGLEKLSDRYKEVGVMGNRDFNPGWHTALDLSNLLTVSEAITRSALTRKESRGGHFRIDYEAKDEAQSKVNTIIRKAADGSMQVAQEPLVPMTEEHKAIIDEMK
jgi:succinate dehydrogenase / fumarate reductase flavoprotein subunit